MPRVDSVISPRTLTERQSQSFVWSRPIRSSERTQVRILPRPGPSSREGMTDDRTARLTAESLVERALAGESQAFGVLVRQYQDYACGVASGLLGDPEMGRDVVQKPSSRRTTSCPVFVSRLALVAGSRSRKTVQDVSNRSDGAGCPVKWDCTAR